MEGPAEIGNCTFIEQMVVILGVRGAAEDYWSSVEIFGGSLIGKYHSGINLEKN